MLKLARSRVLPAKPYSMVPCPLVREVNACTPFLPRKGRIVPADTRPCVIVITVAVSVMCGSKLLF